MSFAKSFACVLVLSSIGSLWAAPSMEFVSPRGGEIFFEGQVQPIKLLSRFNTISLEISRDGGNTFAALGQLDNKSLKPADRNKLNWSVTGPASTNCVLRATRTLGGNTSSVLSSPFSIGVGDAIGAGSLPQGPVSGSTLTSGSVATSALADGSVTTPKLADGAVTNPKIGAAAVTLDKVSSGAASGNAVLTSDGIGGASWQPVASSGVADGSITTAKLADACVTDAKIAAVAGAKVTGAVADATTAVNFSGSLVGDVTGTQGATVVSQVGGLTAANVASGVNLANSATNANTPSTLVRRDGSGNFSAGTITGNVTGSASLNVLKSGDTMAGALALANQQQLQLQESSASGTDSVAVRAPAALPASYTLTMPTTAGAAGQVLATDGSGTLSWVASGSAGAIVNGGNTLGANMSIGTNDNFALSFKTNNTDRIQVSNSGTIAIPAFSVAGVVHNAAATGLLSSSLIVNADVDAAAGIVDTKLALIATAGKVANSATTATAANFPNTIVARDASDNFSAGTVTANLVGNVTGAVTGNATTATTAGNVTGTVALGNGGTGATTAANARTNLGLGSAATLNVGTGANNVVQLDGSAQLPAVDGSQLTNIWAAVGSAADHNMKVGNSALSDLAGGTDETAVGHYALKSTTSGVQNTAVGSAALYNNQTGDCNTGMGFWALELSKGSYNSAFGCNALYQVASGIDNTAVGCFAGGGFSNGVTSGSQNTLIGSRAQVSAGADNNEIVIGYNATGQGSNTAMIGNSSVTQLYAYGSWTNPSDRRLKENIANDELGLDFICGLRPVTYNYKSQPGVVREGFIAQEVEELCNKLGAKFNGLNKPRNENSLYALSYPSFVVPLVNAVKTLKADNESLEADNAALKATLTDVLARLAKLEK